MLDAPVLCIAIDGCLIYGGCGDGSVRAWVMEAKSTALRELFCWPLAHAGPVRCVAVERMPDWSNGALALALSSPSSSPVDAEAEEKARAAEGMGGWSLGNVKARGGPDPVDAVVVTGGDDRLLKVWLVAEQED
jgi:hypothetical protein